MFWWFPIGVLNWEQKSQQTGWIGSQWGNEIASIIKNKGIVQQDEYIYKSYDFHTLFYHKMVRCHLINL